MREDMLKEALKELLEGKGTGFELPSIGSAKLKGDLGTFQAATILKRKQTAIADGHAMDIRSQIFESGLPIANGFAIHNPVLATWLMYWLLAHPPGIER
jgi:hypothetical protein